MEYNFDDFSLTIKADELEVPYHLQDETLFLNVRPDLIEFLANEKKKVFYFGYAPNNTADAQDKLLENGIFFRIIGYEKNLGIDLESSSKEILKAFHYLVSNYEPFLTSIMIEQGLSKKEIAVDLL